MIRIGISLGDVTGIGPEVALKAIASEPAGPDTEYVLIGDEAYARGLGRRLGIEITARIE